ncbi:hypothetical protein [Streptomyces anulatus]|uniref:hypothetical protein n=1 Tax=Streptomyces anulatus TaxID=1892 RepID=UPI0033EFEC91
MTTVSVVQVSENNTADEGNGTRVLWRFGRLAWRTRYTPADAQETGRGVALRLQHDSTVLGTCEALCSSAVAAEEWAEKAAGEIAPWVPALIAAGEADRDDLHAERIAYETLRYTAARDEYDNWRDQDDLERVEEHALVIRHLATDAESAEHSDPVRLAQVAGARLTLSAAAARRRALASVPDLAAHAEVGRGWIAPDLRLSTRYLPADEDQTELRAALAVNLLKGWALDKPAVGRDTLIVWAADAGISKAEISRLTGVARTTLDRVLKQQP